MCIKSKKQKETLLKNISSLSVLIRKLCLYCNFVSKSKSLDSEYLKNIINNIKVCLDNIDEIL